MNDDDEDSEMWLVWGLDVAYDGRCMAAKVEPHQVQWITDPVLPWFAIVYDDEGGKHVVRGPKMMLPKLAFEVSVLLRGAGAK